jgi:hypothetical protein
MSILNLDKRVPIRSATLDYSGAVTETMGKPRETSKTSDAATVAGSAVLPVMAMLAVLFFPMDTMDILAEVFYWEDRMRRGFESGVA